MTDTAPGKRLIEAAKEAVAIAKGEQPAASITVNRHRYFPADALSAERAKREEAERERDEWKRRFFERTDVPFMNMGDAEATWLADEAREADAMERKLQEARAVTDDLIEAGAAGMYGRKWSDPDPQHRPGEKMKDVWRKYARDCIEGVFRSLSQGSDTPAGPSPIGPDGAET